MVAYREPTPNRSQRQAPDGHRSAERRSLAMHALIAKRLDAATIERASQRVDVWLESGTVDDRWARAWRDLLANPVAAVAEAIARDDEAMRALRQTTPFAGVLSNAERWGILRSVH